MTIEVRLHSANGTRTTSVNPPRGFPTRHVSTGTPAKSEPITITPNLPAPTPEALAEVDAIIDPTAAFSEGQEIILEALKKAGYAIDLEGIESMTGLNSLYILLECRELAKLGFVEILSTLTVRKFRAARKGTEVQHDA